MRRRGRPAATEVHQPNPIQSHETISSQATLPCSRSHTPDRPAASAQIVGAYWSFNDAVGAGTTLTFDADVNTLPGAAPQVTRSGSSLQLFNANNMGSDFVDFQGTSQTLQGFPSLTWNAGSTDNSLTLRADLTDLEQVSLSLRYRTQTAGSITAFSAFEYRTSAGGAWQNVDYNGTSLTLPEPNSANFPRWEPSLTGTTAADLEGSAFAEFRWSFDSPVNNNFRMDDVQITAIPEPTTYAAILGLSVLGFVLLRRRRA